MCFLEYILPNTYNILGSVAVGVNKCPVDSGVCTYLSVDVRMYVDVGVGFWC